MSTNGKSVEKRADWEQNQQVLQAAYIELLRENGGKRPTVVSVAERAGIATSTAYRHCRHITLEPFVQEAKLHTQAVLDGIIEAASRGDAANARLFFQLVYNWKAPETVGGSMVPPPSEIIIHVADARSNGQRKIEA